MMIKQIINFTALISIVTSVHAGNYIGASLGSANFSDVDFKVESPIMSTQSSIALDDDNSIAVKLYAGYEFNEYLAVEGSLGGYDALESNYASLGKMRFLAMQGRMNMPVMEQLSLFAKAGFAYYGAELKTIYGNVEDDDFTPKFGLGGEFRLSNNISLTAEWDYMKPEMELIKIGTNTSTVSASISVYSLGMLYRF